MLGWFDGYWRSREEPDLTWSSQVAGRCGRSAAGREVLQLATTSDRSL